MENKEQSSDEKIKEIIRKLDWKAFWIGIIGVVVLLTFPILVTDHFLFDYSKTGTLGDTIGGLTAPIIGLFSALLIYLSFRAQIKANYIVQGQIDQQRKDDAEKKEISYQMEVYKHLKGVIEKYECKNEGLPAHRSDSSHHEGYDALRIVLKNLEYQQQNLFRLGSDYYQFIHSVLNQFDSLIESFQSPKNQGYDIRLPLQLVKFMFDDCFWRHVNKAATDAQENRDGKFEEVLRIYDRLLITKRNLSFISQKEEEKQ